MIACLQKVKDLFRHMQTVADRKCFILPWWDEDFSTYECIGYLSQFPSNIVEITIYIPQFFVRQGIGLVIEYLQMFLAHYEDLQVIKKEMRRWLKEEKCEIYCNIL